MLLMDGGAWNPMIAASWDLRLPQLSGGFMPIVQLAGPPFRSPSRSLWG